MTQLSLINYPAILVAALGSFLFGGLWYAIFARRSLRADGSASIGAGRSLPGLLATTFVSLVLMAVMLSGILVHVTRSGIPFTLRSGIFSAVMIWIGFVATTLAASNALHGAPFARTLIDSGYWLGVLLIQATALVMMGV